MKFEVKFRILLWKRYFDKGWELTFFIKYLIYAFGFASRDISSTLLIGFFYGICCTFLGHYYLKHKWLDAEHEVTNRFNPFVKEVRKDLLKTKV